MSPEPKTLLTLRSHWKAALVWAGFGIGIASYVAWIGATSRVQAQHPDPPKPSMVGPLL